MITALVAAAAPLTLLVIVAVLGQEAWPAITHFGPGFLVADFERRWADPLQRETMLWAAEVVESEPEILAASSHLLAVAQSPA